MTHRQNGDPRRTAPSYDETWAKEKPGMLATLLPRAMACSRSVTTSATAEQVEKAALDWAKDLGFTRLRPFLAFSIQNQLWMRRFGEIGVQTFPGQDSMDIRFTAHMGSWRPGNARELQRMADAFAAGVCEVLRSRGATVNPALKSSENRKLLGVVERWRARLYLPFVAVGVPGFVAILVFRGPGRLVPVLFGAFFWLFGVWMASGYVRYRVVGARFPVVLLFVILFLALAIGMAAVAIFTDR